MVRCRRLSAGDGVSVFCSDLLNIYLEIVFHHLKLFPSCADKTDIIVSIFFLNSLHTDVEGQIAIFSAFLNVINGGGE